MKKEKGNFEFVKEDEDNKRNYIFQKDKITKTGTIIVAAFLVVLIVAVILSGVLVDFKA
ncbi:hypothetical protein [Jejuia pallidilutea]|jgi:hypothetical protein|uniref:Uncharacterized protein n=1 Tax=Jejuia pallidilutea TaxID=504487 RepID=A0A090VLE4_9FLAO|nr:hypothetical protein [Jejuia pallidilutea]PQV49434.1 hypothetical protein CLV33_10364 [Jejuia pallidilutea]GAL65575.1 hypothetical protein JCM19301_4035 [Jejuia pallidilutea]GAL70138.1 hypothetical protein JCM19302_2713 [Jejuia pallidilutea]GAL88887.1 hypothetical protein JCM19538_1876 [Jejuia pallidilutea]